MMNLLRSYEELSGEKIIAITTCGYDDINENFTANYLVVATEKHGVYILGLNKRPRGIIDAQQNLFPAFYEKLNVLGGNEIKDFLVSCGFSIAEIDDFIAIHKKEFPDIYYEITVYDNLIADLQEKSTKLKDMLENG